MIEESEQYNEISCFLLPPTSLTDMIGYAKTSAEKLEKECLTCIRRCDRYYTKHKLPQYKTQLYGGFQYTLMY